MFCFKVSSPQSNNLLHYQTISIICSKTITYTISEQATIMPNCTQLITFLKPIYKNYMIKYFKFYSSYMLHILTKQQYPKLVSKKYEIDEITIVNTKEPILITSYYQKHISNYCFHVSVLSLFFGCSSCHALLS